jgi:alpha-ribazole phosphatase
MKITLIRHTSLQITPGICYGQSDIDVAASFMQEANVLRQKLHGITFHAIYTSPLQRCIKLAHALDLGEPTHDAHLKELHFGDWEMQAWEDIPRDIFDEWAHNYAELAPPNGETFQALQTRGIAFLDSLLNGFEMPKNDSAHIAIVTHGGMIRALIAHVLGMPLKGLFRFNIDYASVTQLEISSLDFKQHVPKINFINR